MAAVSRTVNRSELSTDGTSPAPVDEVGILSCLAFPRQRAKPEVLQQKTKLVCPFQHNVLCILFWFVFNFWEYKHAKYFIAVP